MYASKAPASNIKSLPSMNKFLCLRSLHVAFLLGAYIVQRLRSVFGIFLGTRVPLQCITTLGYYRYIASASTHDFTKLDSCEALHHPELNRT